jgi:hypothetical protein
VENVSDHWDATFRLPSISCRVMRTRAYIFLKFLKYKIWW